MSLLDRIKDALKLKPDYRHIERDLAKQAGLGVEILKAVRVEHLQRGRDWELVGGFICYSDAGLAKASARLKIAFQPDTPPAPPDAPPPDSAANTPPADTPPAPPPYVEPKAGEERELTCVATVLNKRVVKADDQGRVAWVRVNDSKNFRPGLVFKASFVSGDLWELVGRCPRWPGKF